MQISTIIKFAFIALYLVAIFIIAGIDKEYRKIERSVLYYGLMVSCCYIIYLCIIGQTSIYRYVMYLVTLILLLIIDSETQIQRAKSSYLLEVLMLIVVMAINTGLIVTITSIIITLLAIAITKILYNISNYFNKFRKEQKNITNEINKFGYLFGITNVILFIGSLYFGI